MGIRSMKNVKARMGSVASVTLKVLLAAALVCGLAPSLSWAADAEGVRADAETVAILDVPADNTFESGVSVFDFSESPVYADVCDECLAVDDDQGIQALAQAVASDGWNAYEGIEWRIDDEGCLTIRPLGNGTSGSFELRRGSSYLPWLGLAKTVYIAEGVCGRGYIGGMFLKSRSLVSADLSNLDTSEVTDMGWMFSECNSLTSLNLSNFDTSNVTYMEGMFDGCYSLTTLDLTSFNTSSVEDMGAMFYYCASLTSLDVTKFDTSQVTDMSVMFYRCSSLMSIYCNDDWSHGSVDYSSGMFEGCTSLKGAISYDSSKTDIAYANPDTGYFTRKDASSTNPGDPDNPDEPDNPDNPDTPETKTFTIGRDNNKFAHPVVENYFMGSRYYDSLVVNATEGEKDSIKEKMSTYYVVTEEGGIKKTWGGSCGGLATTMGLLYDGLVGVEDLSYIDYLQGVDCYYGLTSPANGNNQYLKSAINYYQLAQYLDSYPVVKSWNRESASNEQSDSLTATFRSLVNALRAEGSIVMFGYGSTTPSEDSHGNEIAKSYGHRQIACACNYSKDEGNYVVSFYDLNDIAEYHELTISEDFSEFSFEDSVPQYGGGAHTQDNCTFFKVYSLSDIAKVGNGIKGLQTSITSEPSAQSISALSGSDTIRLNVSLAGAFTLKNAQGQTLVWDGDSFSGDMAIYSADYIGDLEGITVKLEIDASDSFSVTYNDMQESEIAVYNTNDYLSLAAQGAKSSTLALGDGIDVSGTDGTFTAFVSTGKEVAEGESGLVSVSADFSSDVSISQGYDDVSVTSSTSLKNVSSYSYVNIGKYALAEDVSGKAFSFDPTDTVWTRLSGQNRFDTMRDIALEAFDQSEYAVVATGDNFPDALAASSLSGALDAPVVLVGAGNTSQAADVLNTLGVSKIYCIGGTTAVPQSWIDELTNAAQAKVVKRLSGDTRQETAVAIANEVAALGAAPPVAVIATGKNFPDALSISSYTYANTTPIYLTLDDGTLDAKTLSAIKGANYSSYIYVGGTAVVSDAVTAQLGTSFSAVTRLAGDDRYGSSADIAAYCQSHGLRADYMSIATGESFPDALTGAALAGSQGSIIMLASDEAYSQVKDVISANSITRAYILGGSNALSNDVVNALFGRGE